MKTSKSRLYIMSSFKSSNCRFYGSMKGCKNGNQCPYNHSNPNSVPLCRFINGCRYGRHCQYRHIDHDNKSFHAICYHNS